MAERRTVQRRIVKKRPPEPAPRSDRRAGERRDSPRVPMAFLVRNLEEGGSYVEERGDLSLGGIYWTGRYSPGGTDVEVRFRLPRVTREIRAQGEIIRLDDQQGGVGFHVRFTQLDVESELAIARFLERA
jgi:hypothetical protein